jgi:hypothetical protein
MTARGSLRAAKVVAAWLSADRATASAPHDGWIPAEKYGDLPSFLARVPEPLATGFRRALATRSPIDFDLADLLPPFSPERCVDPTVLALYAHTFMALHRYSEAIACYQRGADLLPRSASVRADLGWAAWFGARVELARSAWKASLRLGNDDYVVRRALDVLR